MCLLSEWDENKPRDCENCKGRKKMSEKISSDEEIKKIVLEEEKKGNVVFMTFDGLMGASLEEIVKQPVEGLLYDLNRDKVTILTFINKEKWINDYALSLVVAKLHAQNAELRTENADMREALELLASQQMNTCYFSVNEKLTSFMDIARAVLAKYPEV